MKLLNEQSLNVRAILPEVDARPPSLVRMAEAWPEVGSREKSMSLIVSEFSGPSAIRMAPVGSSMLAMICAFCPLHGTPCRLR